MGQCPAQTRGRRMDAEPARRHSDHGRRRHPPDRPRAERPGADGRRRAIIARLELLTEHDRYRWLNSSFVVGEGEIDEETEKWWIHAFVCVNEVAEHPPGIGQRRRRRSASRSYSPTPRGSL